MSVNCFGWLCRLRGHSRVPTPPARIAAYMVSAPFCCHSASSSAQITHDSRADVGHGRHLTHQIPLAPSRSTDCSPLLREGLYRAPGHRCSRVLCLGSPAGSTLEGLWGSAWRASDSIVRRVKLSCSSTSSTESSGVAPWRIRSLQPTLPGCRMLPGTANMSLPCSAANRAVINAPLRSPASTITIA